ncbi:MAG: hypothetical protein SGI92_26055 [Bryobacteraceae bacterium]|nr:hypothetical protein [Bryobacteraceae bacterium]
MRLCVIFLALFPLAGADTLPQPLTKLIDSRYPGWKPAPVVAQITEWFREYRFPFDPNLVRADFNNDGQDDWAVLLLAGGREVAVAVISTRKSGWKLFELSSDSPDPFTYLLLYARGESDFDFKTLRKFRHKANSLGLMHFRTTPLQFTWKRTGGFERALSLSDEELENQD